ncbi:efflux RND transporter permease subunit [Olivibacter sp. XZL3]|uniref:efflux RND transporter permease subunit n=1 Tax=Olivibacter sp. XZL3 TaxID=1735116 RepID=UPI00106661B8|nr:efflux RND transporter permease subunit [Olivibacter sp. XZL3]
MFEIFIKRPVLSLVISLFITLLGLLSLFTLPVTQFPDIVPPSVVVNANYTGANAEVSTNAVAIPLEKAINGVPGMTYMSSVSTNNGNTLIQVYFEVGTDPDIAAVNVQNRVTTVLDELPEEVIKAGVTTEKEVNSMLMYLNIYSDDETADERFIYNFTDINILKELKRIQGVGRAEIMGFKDYAMRVWLKPDRLTAYRVSSEDVIKAIRAQNVEAAPGQTGIGSDKSVNMQQYVLRYPGKFDRPEQYENIPLRANPDGSILRLRDVADVEFGSLEYEMSSKADGRPSASIMIKQLPGSNASEVIDLIKAKMEELKGTTFPPGMKYTMGYDVSRFLDASINEVLHTLVEAFILVFLVVFIFLQDFRSTLVPALAVPVCLIGALFCMQMLGFSINLLTLFALVLAIGIVVDNAIVVVEAVYVKMEEEHMQPMEATLAAMKEISGAIIAITLVMSAVFVPVAFLSGPVGVFYRQFSLTLAGSILISGINALTLTPALCAIILRSPHNRPEPRGVLATFFKKFNKVYNKISGKYAGLIGRIAGRRVITLAILVLSFIATWGISSILPSGFIPTEDQGMIYVNVTTPPGATVQRTEAVLDEIDAIARQMESVESVSTLAGYSLVNEVTGASYGMGMINLKRWEERKESVGNMVERLKKETSKITDAEIEFFPPPTVPGFGNSSGFELRVLDRSGSDDLSKLSDVLNTFMNSLKKTPEIGSAFTSFDPNFPQYLINVDYDIAAKKGISVDNAMSTLQTLMGSFYTSNFIKFGQMYKVMVQAGPGYREKPEDVLRLFVKNEAGEMVPFSSFIKMERIYGPEQLTRYNMFTSAMINGDAAPGYSSGDVIAAVERVAAESLPRGFEIEWSGMTREQILSGNQAIYVFALCLLFVYLLLCAQYESFLLPLPVILSLPAGVFGAFLFLKLLGLENNIYAQVALIMLIGLLGKNAILIIEYALLKHKQGASILDAAIEGSVARLRPILMTSFAFIAGLIPLAMASGAGALGNRSIGTTAIGGMIIGTIAGVIIIPGLYVLFASMKKKKKVKKVTGVAVAIAGILLFASCGVQKEIEPIHRKVPEHYRGKNQTDTLASDTASMATISWRSFFQDEYLLKLIDTALANNPDMRQALYRVEIARANMRLGKNALFPSINAVAEAGLRKYGFYTMDGIGNYDTNFSENLKDDERVPDPVPDYFLGLRASWEIDIWGKLKNRRKAAFARFLASYEGQKLVQTQLIAEIASAYFELLALDNELYILEKNIALQQESYELVQVQKEGGRATELGVQQMRAILMNSKSRKEMVLQQINSKENYLNFLCGRFSSPIERRREELEAYPLAKAVKVGLPAKMLALRPDIRAAELNLLAAKGDVKAARAAFLPSLSFSPYIGFQSFDMSKLFVTSPSSVAYGLLGGLTAPLFNQRMIRSNYEQELANKGIEYQEYEKTVLKAWQEVETELNAQRHLRARRSFNQHEVDALRLSVDASSELFKAGRANYLDVITSQRNVLDAEITLNSTYLEYLQSVVNLYKALGGGWQ